MRKIDDGTGEKGISKGNRMLNSPDLTVEGAGVVARTRRREGRKLNWFGRGRRVAVLQKATKTKLFGGVELESGWQPWCLLACCRSLVMNTPDADIDDAKEDHLVV